MAVTEADTIQQTRDGQASCPVCATEAGKTFFALQDVPVFCNVLWDDKAEAANAAKGDVELVCCEGCGLVYNRAFDPSKVEYAPDYENALHFSKSFQLFAEDLSNHLVEHHALAGKTVAEIGCGDGYFLKQMVKAGVGRGIGFDPSMEENDKRGFIGENVEIVPKMFLTGNLPAEFDLVICRHVLEHLQNPLALLTDIRDALGDRRSALYFEVPNAGWILDDCSLWDFIYEHYTYWTAPTLRALFSEAGFEVLNTTSGFGDQFLMIEAHSTQRAQAPSRSEHDVKKLSAACQLFAKTANGQLQRWQRELGELGATGKKVAVWGAGSKGITFVNAVSAAREAVVCVVDLNPRKHGKFIAGSAHPVLPPESLADLQPDVVIIPNALYEREIAAQLSKMGITPKLMTLL